MRRPFALALTLCLAASARAQEPAARPSALPVRAVTLFSSGVSFTLREGEVSGDAVVPLTFRTAQINDILKSLVQLDEKGQVRPAIYGAKDPIGRTLQSFAVDVTQPLSRAELLNRLRGVKVEVTVETKTAQGSTTSAQTGQVVAVEMRPTVVAPNQVTQTERLTLLTESGLTFVSLDEVTGIKLLDARLDREFREALTLLASGADDKRRQVALRFVGQGARRVRVGYVTEAPLWKVSYRLLLGGSGISGVPARSEGATPYLQGWALVENTSDEDWSDIRLSLVSGRPISFIQDLYQPLYLPRPVVAPDVQASPEPQVAEGAVELKDKEAEKRDAPAFGLGRRAGGFGGGGMPGGGGLPAPAPVVDSAADMASNAAALRGSVTAQASGEAAGELFTYVIKTPVSLPRQQAAMIPIVAGAISGEKTLLYNPDSIHPTIPMNAVRIKNDTGLYLKAGPVTLFDDGTYAGDARLPDIPPGDARLITYALDSSLAAERQNKGGASVETGILIRRGVLIVSRRESIETLYILRNKSDRPRTVLVEHPFDSAYTLVQPAKFEERTPSLYRFAVAVAPGKTETLTVRTERPLSEELGLVNGDLNRILLLTQRKSGIPEKVKAALLEVLTRRQKLADLQSDLATRGQEIQAIEQDQERIRRNMAALDRDSSLYKRYVTELDGQETRIQNLRADVVRLQGAYSEAQRSLSAYLDTLTITG